MFVLKSLGRLILGNTEQKELLAIPNGKLLVTGAGKEEVYFERAMLHLKRGDKPYSYSLEVEDESLEETSESFPVARSLKFQKSVTAGGATCFEWHAGELTFQFEFAADTSTTTTEMFNVTMAQCMFEAENRRSHVTASDAELREFMLISAKVNPSPRKRAGQVAETVVFQSESSAGWYAFDPNTGMFSPKAEECCPAVTREDNNRFRYHLVILDKEKKAELHRQLIDPDATHHTDRSSFSFVWCFLSENGYIWTFSLRFQSAAAVMALSNAIGQAIYEILNEEKMSAEDSKYLLNPFSMDIEMPEAPPLDIGSEGEEDEEDESATTNGEGSSSEGLVDVKTESDEEFRNLAVGYKHDRSFVSKGSSLGVFKHTEDDRLEPYTVIQSGFRTMSGSKSSFVPSKMMLHQEDSSLLLMNPDDRQHIYKMDLEVGKVVEEWQIKDDVPVTNILPSAKYSQMTNDPTLIGINDSSLFRIDPRISGPNKRVDDESKSYVVKNRFSCGTTTGKGELALASAKGDIRLFNKLDKRAKTLLPGFGDPIIGIDVTESGKWIIATCKTYLLLINTEIEGTDALGFSKSLMGQDRQPKTTVRLQLKPEHVAYMGTPVSFTPARFSTGESEERSIITSTGPYVVSWNFRRVKQGKLYEYQLKRYSDTIVADNFRFGQDRAMIVALPHHVTMMTKKSLSTPSPRVLRGRGKASDVVDAPF